MPRPGVGSAKPPGKAKNRDDGRRNDRQHDRDGIDQDRLLGGADRALRSNMPMCRPRAPARTPRSWSGAPHNSQLRPDGTHSKIPAAADGPVSVIHRARMSVKTSKNERQQSGTSSADVILRMAIAPLLFAVASSQCSHRKLTRTVVSERAHPSALKNAAGVLPRLQTNRQPAVYPDTVWPQTR